jgi:hypothetical protein
MAHQDTRRWPSAAVSSLELAELKRSSEENAVRMHLGYARGSPPPESKRFDVAARLSERVGVHKTRFQDSSERFPGL